MDYLVLKMTHQTAVVLALTGFFARGVGVLLNAGWIRSRPARTLPHVVDTVLLISALWMAIILGLTPTNAPWLLAKLIGLVVYIGLGVIALHPGRPANVRLAAWVAALLVFGWIVSVAILKSPLGIFLLI